MKVNLKGENKPVLIITAAGKGRRMGGGESNKVYFPLAGKPVLAHTLQAFLGLQLFSPVLIVVAPGEESIFNAQVRAPFFPENKQLFLIEGGQQRQHSVFNALKCLNKKNISGETIVCIHDGARPLIDQSLILNVYRGALASGAAVAGVALQDTIKEIDNRLMVRKTPPRENFMAIQTPQCFKYSTLWQAHCRAGGEKFLGSDDAVLVERLGVKVKVVPGSYTNLKLTTPIDLEVAGVYLKGRRGQG
jgi:2-C-methyl-D-erythritol 4-phosphate cytidylyltransferase